MNPARMRVLVLLAVFLAAALTGSAATNPLTKVRSIQYLIASGPNTPGINDRIANGRTDLTILSGDTRLVLNRAAADPRGDKLIFGYLDVAEASAFWYPAEFAKSPRPSWIGQPVPGFTDLYTAQYWHPDWEPLLLTVLDRLIANGYDGVFLDVLSGNTHWSPGNSMGNPTYADAVPALARLLVNLRKHLTTKYPNKPFYLLGNNPTTIGPADPSVLKNLDGIFTEVLYYVQSSSDASRSQYHGTVYADFITRTLHPLYVATGLPLFGCDYPPLADHATVLQSFHFYSALGWVPTVTNPLQDARILSSGPFMFMSVPENPAVTGYPSFVNFLSGGKTPHATLTGGNMGDYFIGGPGRNTIVGGAGNDTIYAHPANVNDKGRLVIEVSSTIKGNGTTPSVSIALNGAVVVPPTPITAQWGKDKQTYTFDVGSSITLSSLIFTVSGCSYTNPENFSNASINRIAHHSVPIDLTLGTFTDGRAGREFNYSNNGRVTFSASALAVESPYPENTSSVIDGGGGINSVVYRGPYGNYTITRQPDGSWLVVSRSTAEGPDTLKNVQTLVFSDQQVSLAAPYNGTPKPRLTNLSVRTTTGGASPLTAGFVIGGSGEKSVLVRGIGPALTGFGVSGALSDPTLRLVDGAGATRATNSGWGNTPALSAAFTQVGAFPLAATSRDSALLSTVEAGGYTAQVSAANNGAGVVLLEVYDADAAPPAAHIVNLSARNFAGTDSQTLVAGFTVQDWTAKVLIRGIGPGLAQFGLQGVLAAPQLTLFDSTSTPLASNAGWTSASTRGASRVSAILDRPSAAAFTQVGAFALPAGSADSALLISLPPGSYTAQVTGANGTTGEALIEIYLLP